MPFKSDRQRKGFFARKFVQVESPYILGKQKLRISVSKQKQLLNEADKKIKNLKNQLQKEKRTGTFQDIGATKSQIKFWKNEKIRLRGKPVTLKQIL